MMIIKIVRFKVGFLVQNPSVPCYHEERGRENLLHEGVTPEVIFTTGNTVIDALKMTVKDNYSFYIIGR